jgi:hypothetical protein
LNAQKVIELLSMSPKNTNKNEKISKTMQEFNQTSLRKKAMIGAMKSQLGIVTKAAKIVGIERRTFYRWYEEDEDFKAAIDDIENIALDYVEGKLYELIQEKNVTAVIFHLKCRGKKRGYSEKSQVEHSGEIDINANVDVTKLSKEELYAIATAQSACSIGADEA